MSLDSICNKYCEVQYNENNYSIGGGLDSSKFASVRHEDAKNDAGKLTIGEATQLFKKATGLDTNTVKEVLQFAAPNMEWHHAGKLPKSYGGGMKKTYFLNASEICDVAKNWNLYAKELNTSKEVEKLAIENKNNLEQRKHNFLIANAKRFERLPTTPKGRYYILTAQEMKGKHGWFDSTYKSYKLPEFFSGWEFESEEKYGEYLNIK